MRRMGRERVGLREAVRALERLYGRPPSPPTDDPYLVALRENVAYLVDDARRDAAYESLRKSIGLEPDALEKATVARIVAGLGGSGGHAARCAEKLKECAAIAREVGRERLRDLARGDPAAARKILKRFPGIGDPGADRMLLLARSLETLAPESNGLRVLQRLGFAPETDNYARAYKAAAEAVAPELPEELDDLIAARELLRTHGKELCTRTRPKCEACPLARRCPAAAPGKTPCG